MTALPCADVLGGKAPKDTPVTVKGWVRTRRDSKAGISFVHLADGSSFHPVQVVVPSALQHIKSGGVFVLLVKPQFECGPEWVEKGGVVRDPAARQRAVESVEAMLIELGCKVMGHVDSPILGPAGNAEILVAGRKG